MLQGTTKKFTTGLREKSRTIPALQNPAKTIHFPSQPLFRIFYHFWLFSGSKSTGDSSRKYVTAMLKENQNKVTTRQVYPSFLFFHISFSSIFLFVRFHWKRANTKTTLK